MKRISGAAGPFPRLNSREIKARESARWFVCIINWTIETDFFYFHDDQRNYPFKELICILNKSVGICDPALIIPRSLDVFIISKKLKTEVVRSSLLSTSTMIRHVLLLIFVNSLSAQHLKVTSIVVFDRWSLIFSSRSDRRKLFRWDNHRPNGLVGSIRCRRTLPCRFSLSIAGECAFSIYSSRWMTSRRRLSMVYKGDLWTEFARRVKLVEARTLKRERERLDG